MSRRPARCTQADIRRALAAAEAAGVDVTVDILPDGTIRMEPQEAPPPSPPVPVPPPTRTLAPLKHGVLRNVAGQRVGRVYFIRGESTGNIKIGFSVFPKERISDLRVASSEPLTLLGHFAGTFDDEQNLHKRFKAHRQRGEWFSPSPELLAHIEEVCRAPTS